MRWTVLSSDALIFFPAVLYFVLVYYRNHSSRRKSDVAWHIAMILINPCLILVDHGHFQVLANFCPHMCIFFSLQVYLVIKLCSTVVNSFSSLYFPVSV